MKIKIEDIFGVHNGYMLDLQPGYTPLVGPNGAGKTTLLHQLRDYAKEHDILLFQYSNLVEGGAMARNSYIFHNDPASLSAATFSSEGEQIAFNFGQAVRKLGAAVCDAKAQGKPLFILLDALDSGASIDRARELRSLFNLICQDAGETVYIVCACNSYELVRGEPGVNVRTGQKVKFKDYEEYADFIYTFLKRYAPKENGQEAEKGGTRMRPRRESASPGTA